MRKLREKLMKNSDDIHSPEVRTAYGKLSSCVGIACNALLFLGKMLVGTIFGSVSITADAVNNLSDASSSVISLFGFKLANKPADAEHPYGHGRYEYLSGLMVAVLIMVIGVELLRSSFEKILAPSPVAFSWISIAVLSFSVLLKLWMAYFNRKIGKKIDSQKRRHRYGRSACSILDFAFRQRRTRRMDGTCCSHLHSVQRIRTDPRDA